MENNNNLYSGIFTFIIIILVVTILSLFFRRMFRIFNPEPFDNIWNEKKAKKIISLIQRTQKCFQKLNIEFIPMYGSLLGVVRHQSIIPWDDDYDICVNKKYFETILSNEKLFDDHNLKIVVKQPLLFEHKFLKIFDKNEKLIPDRDWAWPFIDIFAYTIKDDNVLLENHDGKTSFDKFEINDFFPLKNSFFILNNHKIEIQTPHNSEKILNILYGNNWKDMCYSSGYNHQLERYFDKVYKRKCHEIMKIK